MLRLLASSSVVVVLLSVATTAHADVVAIEGTIKSVDAEKRTITVETDGEEKTLDLSRKAKVAREEKDASLDSLMPGQKVKLSYHDELEIVLKIEVASHNANQKDREVPLFNGTDLQGWKFETAKAANGSKASKPVHQLWRVEAERNVLVALGKQNCWLETTQKYQDFTLTCDWRFIPGGKVTDSGSGIVVRANGRNLSGTNPRGIEIDIVPFNMSMAGDFLLYGAPLESKKGKAAGEKNVRLQSLHRPTEKPTGQWNTCEIECIGDRVKVTINGTLVNEAWGAKAQPGTICIRNQWSVIEFRNIRLKVVSGDDQ